MVRFLDGKSFGEKNASGVGVGYAEIACISTDTKPTAGFATGSICVEVDTGKVYFFEEPSTWVEQFSFQG